MKEWVYKKMSAEKEKLKGIYTGRWNARFTLKFQNNKSKRIFKRGFKSKKEALEYEKEMIINNSLGSNILFKKMVEQYLEFKKPRIKENTYNTIKIVFRNVTFFDNFLISQITPKIITDFQNELIAKYKARTIKQVNLVIKMLFTWCVRYRNLVSNPFDMVDRLNLETSKRMDIITVDEFNQIIADMKNKDMKLMFKVLFWTGLRIGEARALKIDDIDFNLKTIRVNKNYVKLGMREIITSPKTKSSIRNIKIDNLLAQDIRQYLEEAFYIIDNGFIFKYSKIWYSREFKNICKKVLGRDIRLHDLRHSHASFLINNGVDVLLISKRLGHSTPTMTLNVYSHLYPSKENEVIELINKIKLDEES